MPDASPAPLAGYLHWMGPHAGGRHHRSADRSHPARRTTGGSASMNGVRRSVEVPAGRVAGPALSPARRWWRIAVALMAVVLLIGGARPEPRTWAVLGVVALVVGAGVVLARATIRPDDRADSVDRRGSATGSPAAPRARPDRRPRPHRFDVTRAHRPARPGPRRSSRPRCRCQRCHRPHASARRCGWCCTRAGHPPPPRRPARRPGAGGRRHRPRRARAGSSRVGRG